MWNEFFVTLGGAAATLTGLIFVGVSINLTRILSIARLPDRAYQSLLLLLTVLVVSALCLVPGQPTILVGIELLVIGITVWTMAFRLDLRILHNTDTQYKNQFRRNMIMTELAIVPYIIAGAVLAGNNSLSGFYWLIPAMIFSFIKAVSDAWVLLVEINR